MWRENHFYFSNKDFINNTTKDYLLFAAFVSRFIFLFEEYICSSFFFQNFPNIFFQEGKWLWLNCFQKGY